MTTVHVYHAQGANVCAAVRRRDTSLDVRAIEDEATLLATVPDLAYLLAARPPRFGWSRASRLRLLQLMGAGVDHVLPSPDLPGHVSIAGARGLFAAETAEHAIAMLLALWRGLPALVDRQRERRWRPFASHALEGRTMCVFGLGEVGRRIARTARALGMHVIGVRRTSRPCPDVHAIASLPEALPFADVLMVAAACTSATRRAIDAAAIATMPHGAVIVNVARGALLEERAVFDALRRGALGGAALDVLEEEPPGPEHPAWTTPNLLITPHQAGLGVDYVDRVVDRFVDNVQRIERGEPPVGLVDHEHGY